MNKKITNNLGLKILALVCSFALWLIVVNINDPVTTKTFYGIAVKVSNEDAIANEGKVYEVVDGTDTVNVTVSAKRSIIDSLSEDNIKATADMEELSFMNTVRIKVSTNKYNDKINNIKSNIENLEVDIEDLQEKQIAISSITSGTPADGYVVGDVKPSETVVRIEGPESVVSKVAQAIAIVNVDGMSNDIKTSVDLALYDDNDTVVSDDRLTMNIEKVSVNVAMLATKDVPLKFNVTGTPATGYGLTGQVDSDPATIMVAGQEEDLEDVKQITIPGSALSIDGQSTNVTTLVDITPYLPDTVRLADSSSSGQVTVEVYIEAQTTEVIQIPEENVVLTNIPEGIYAAIEATENGYYEITIQGMEQTLANVNPVDVTGTVDMQEYMQSENLEKLKKDTYSMAVTFELADGVSTLDTYEVNVGVTDNE